MRKKDSKKRQQTSGELIKKPFELIVIARPPSQTAFQSNFDPLRADFPPRFTVCDSCSGRLAAQNPIIHLLIVIFLFPDFRKMKITFLWQLEDFLVKFRDYSRHRIRSDCIRPPAPWRPCVVRTKTWVNERSDFLFCCWRLGQLRSDLIRFRIAIPQFATSNRTNSSTNIPAAASLEALEALENIADRVELLKIVFNSLCFRSPGAIQSTRLATTLAVFFSPNFYRPLKHRRPLLRSRTDEDWSRKLN